MVEYVGEILLGFVVINGVTAFLTVHALKIHVGYLKRDVDELRNDVGILQRRRVGDNTT